jgi:hypothetical protein
MLKDGPNYNNRGMPDLTDGKLLGKMIGYLARGGKLAYCCLNTCFLLGIINQ